MSIGIDRMSIRDIEIYRAATKVGAVSQEDVANLGDIS